MGDLGVKQRFILKEPSKVFQVEVYVIFKTAEQLAESKTRTEADVPVRIAKWH